MKAVLQLFALAAVVSTSNALYTNRDVADAESVCASGTVVSNTTLNLNGIDIEFATFDCAPASTSFAVDLRIGGIIIPIPIFPWPIFPFPLPPIKPRPTKTIASTSTSTSASASPTPTTVNVCDVACTNSCGSLGDLPPISEDCQQIYDALNITSGSIAPTFDIPSNNIHQLTFGTCRVFFENFSNETVTFCWSALSQEAQGAGSACFPPVQPVNSAGYCTPSDGSWQVGVAHS
ncbi:hypothetical protein BC835DRAFT_430575 [Cytidiella melzeri]|nr:hypothetical protein BC835DRAFT_430575 [Cytidiella melzeri]